MEFLSFRHCPYSPDAASSRQIVNSMNVHERVMDIPLICTQTVWHFVTQGLGAKPAMRRSDRIAPRTSAEFAVEASQTRWTTIGLDGSAGLCSNLNRALRKYCGLEVKNRPDPVKSRRRDEYR